jgi:hypothetical protein
LREVAALAEIKFHQPLLHGPRLAFLCGPADQPMAIERVGLALDQIAVVAQPGCRRCLDHAIVAAVVAFDRSELGGQVLLAADAFARDPRIEEIGAETHLDGDFRL